MTQAAHLGWILSTPGAHYFEVPLGSPELEFGMIDSVEIDEEGFAVGPSKDGLGCDVDWSSVDDHTVYAVRV